MLSPEAIKLMAQANAARVEYAAQYALTSNPGQSRELMKLTHRIAANLAHTPLRQGNSVECATCGASGVAHKRLDGDVFTHRCGDIFRWGEESTIADCDARVALEQARIRELNLSTKPGAERERIQSVIDAHNNAINAAKKHAKGLRRATTQAVRGARK